MISEHIICKPENDNYRLLAEYITNTNHTNIKILLSWSECCSSGENFELAIQEILYAQNMNIRSQKEKTYHLIINFRTEDHAKLNSDIFKAIEKEFAQVLGFNEHQRICAVHQNASSIYMHIAYNMIHHEKYIRQEPFRDCLKRDRICRKLERDLGLAIDGCNEQELGAKPQRIEQGTLKMA